MSMCQFVHHNSYMELYGIELDPLSDIPANSRFKNFRINTFCQVLLK